MAIFECSALCSVWDRPKTLRLLTVAAAFLVMLCAGLSSAFGILEETFKTAFDLTQIQVDGIYVFALLGTLAAPLAGVIHRHYGPFPLSAGAFILLALGYGLMLSAARMHTFYTREYGFLALFNVFIGLGCILLYMAAILTCLRNIDKRKRAVVIGIVHSGYLVGPGLFTGLYRWLATTLPDHNVTAPINDVPPPFATNADATDTLTDVLIFYVSFSGAVSFLALFTLHHYADPEQMSRSSSGRSRSGRSGRVRASDSVSRLTAPALEYSYEVGPDDAVRTDEETDGDDEPAVVTSDRRPIVAPAPVDRGRHWSAAPGKVGLALAKDAKFMCLTGVFLLSGSVTWLLRFRLTVMLQADELAQHEHVAFYEPGCSLLMGVTGAGTAILVGHLSERFGGAPDSGKSYRVNWIIFGHVAAILALIGVDVFPLQFPLWVTASVANGFLAGILWSLCPSLVADCWGSRHFCINWGSILAAWTAVSILFYFAFWAITQRFEPEGSIFDYSKCVSINCFQWPLSIFVGTLGLSLLLAIALLRKVSATPGLPNFNAGY